MAKRTGPSAWKGAGTALVNRKTFDLVYQEDRESVEARVAGQKARKEREDSTVVPLHPEKRKRSVAAASSIAKTALMIETYLVFMATNGWAPFASKRYITEKLKLDERRARDAFRWLREKRGIEIDHDQPMRDAKQRKTWNISFPLTAEVAKQETIPVPACAFELLENADFYLLCCLHEIAESVYAADLQEKGEADFREKVLPVAYHVNGVTKVLEQYGISAKRQRSSLRTLALLGFLEFRGNVVYLTPMVAIAKHPVKTFDRKKTEVADVIDLRAWLKKAV